MAKIEVAGEAILVDDQDLPLIAGRRWRIQRVLSRYVYAIECGKKGVLMHRLISGAPSGKSVDHINGDTRDNRRANLRVCTHQQNMWNRRSVRSLSGFKGVYRQSGMDAWVACIGPSKGRTYLGTFRDPVDAARAYDEAAIERYGEFACINFPKHFPHLRCRSAV